jgi:Mn-dependent DtxR family transcriptional regulator
MVKESDVLKIVEEDILRILGERKEKVSLNSMKAKIKVSHSFTSKAIKILEEGGLISIKKGFINLSKNGLDEAKDIVRNHLALEDYFKEMRGERQAHQAAHLLEHYVSEEVINNIKKIITLKKEGVPLTKFGLNKEGLITDIVSSDYKLFERMISIGILPGEVIEVTHKIPSGLIIKIKNKKIVLDKTIAKEIKVLKYEKS